MLISNNREVEKSASTPMRERTVCVLLNTACMLQTVGLGWARAPGTGPRGSEAACSARHSARPRRRFPSQRPPSPRPRRGHRMQSAAAPATPTPQRPLPPRSERRPIMCADCTRGVRITHEQQHRVDGLASTATLMRCAPADATTSAHKSHTREDTTFVTNIGALPCNRPMRPASETITRGTAPKRARGVAK